MNSAPNIRETMREVPLPSEQFRSLRRVKPRGLIEKETGMAALKQAFVMLRPDTQWKNPVMFVVEVGAFLTLLFIVQAAWGRQASQVPITYFIALDAWLFLTVLFANFATALAEARGKAQADSLRRARHDTVAYRLNDAGIIEEVSSTVLKPGDQVVVQAGQTIPGDGEIIEGIASVDESAITGESAPVIRAAGGD
ncbi:MAG TPA: potassium-transporting ATPase subunit B, partial [Syntrophobacteraceae bacterium]|nr:potassium-transporting ATPase subunit B [Syntrophobacteraceae bacterium]